MTERTRRKKSAAVPTVSENPNVRVTANRAFFQTKSCPIDVHYSHAVVEEHHINLVIPNNMPFRIGDDGDQSLIHYHSQMFVLDAQFSDVVAAFRQFGTLQSKGPAPKHMEDRRNDTSTIL